MADYKISSFANPTIKLDEILIPNRSIGDESLDRGLKNTDANSIGIFSPWVVINGLPLNSGLVYFQLDLNERIPIVRLEYKMTTSLFLGMAYPKDGDIISVFLSSPGKVYKPIRMDFNVLSVKSSSKPRGNDPIFQEGLEINFSILGETRIPRLYSTFCKSFPAHTSYNTIFEVSQELELGFSANDTELTDSMTWISPNISRWEFLNSVIEHAYKDDESFYDYWIDPYYNLNFVNLAPAFNQMDIVNDSVMVVPGQNKTLPETQNPGISSNPQEYPLLLTNTPGFDDFPFKIRTYTLISNAGQHTNLTGYVQDIIYYDQNEENVEIDKRFIQYQIEATTIHSVGDGQQLQKGRGGEDIYRQEIRRKWLGILNKSPIGSTHANFFHAQVQNPMNLLDATKFTLRVELQGYFPSIYKGQVIPVEIYSFEDGLRRENTGKSQGQQKTTQQTPVIDVFLSGNYVLMGYEVIFTPGRGLIQILNLCKRVWDLNTAGSLPKVSPIEF